MKLSIIIPVFDEKETVLKLIKKVEDVDLGIEKEIIIVDDCSKDGTTDILCKIKSHKVLFHTVNQGKGAAVITGLKKATGDLLTVQDADMEYDPNDYKKLLIEVNKGCNVVYGSRFMNENNSLFKNPTHYIGNKGLSLITSLLYFQRITDMETCYKMFTKEVYNKLNLKAKRFDFEPEITAKIIKAGYKIKEVPINYYPRGFDEGKKISWKDGCLALLFLIKYRFVD